MTAAAVSYDTARSLSDVSAVVLSERPPDWRRLQYLLDAGLCIHSHVSRIRNAAELLEARISAIREVRTTWFFCLDDDDELPPDFADVIRQCIAARTPLTYTDELVNGQVRRSAPYSQELHINNALLVHHLAVCTTIDARVAALTIPRGTFMFENLLFFEVAKRGATYVPRIGYHWLRRPDGLHRHPSLLIGQVASSTWAAGHRQ